MTREQMSIIERYIAARRSVADDWQKEVSQWKYDYLNRWICSEPEEDPRQNELLEWAKRIEPQHVYGSEIYDGKKVAMSFFDESHTRANRPKEHNEMSFDDAMGFGVGGADEN